MGHPDWGRGTPPYRGACRSARACSLPPGASRPRWPRTALQVQPAPAVLAHRNCMSSARMLRLLPLAEQTGRRARAVCRVHVTPAVWALGCAGGARPALRPTCDEPVGDQIKGPPDVLIRQHVVQPLSQPEPSPPLIKREHQPRFLWHSRIIPCASARRCQVLEVQACKVEAVLPAQDVLVTFACLCICFPTHRNAAQLDLHVHTLK